MWTVGVVVVAAESGGQAMAESSPMLSRWIRWIVAGLNHCGGGFSHCGEPLRPLRIQCLREDPLVLFAMNSTELV